MKKTWFCMVLVLTGCADAPSAVGLTNNAKLMNSVQEAAMLYAPGRNPVPIKIALSVLAQNRLITKEEIALIKTATRCENLAGLELLFTRGKVEDVSIEPSVCNKPL